MVFYQSEKASVRFAFESNFDGSHGSYFGVVCVIVVERVSCFDAPERNEHIYVVRSATHGPSTP